MAPWLLQGVPNNYETDLIFPIVAKVASLAAIDYHTADADTKTALKVIGDHTRAVTYLLSDGVIPSNVGRGYVVRRLIRRVVMKGRLLGIKDAFTPAVAEVAVALSGPCDPQVRGCVAMLEGVGVPRCHKCIDMEKLVLKTDFVGCNEDLI